jgi:2-deoxy-D-gluconate 3-dehydrogenase
MGILNSFSLEGKTAIVTGCKRGIGKAMAIGLAEAGANIIGVSASLELEGSEVEKAVQATGKSFKAYQCDFSNRKALYAFINEVKADFPVIDILVNNAGTMIARGSGKVVFTASLLTFQGGITVPGYAASKGAVGQLTMAFANEWASKGVNVNAIAPGYIATDNTEALRNDADRSTSILSRIPAGRWGEAKDFAGPVVFLCSDAAAYMHGSIMLVDGGWMGR